MFYNLIFPKISIVTPSFNQGKFIEQTILSVLDQNYPNLEYIIIDGGSTDNTIDIIKRYKDRITFWVSEPDNGQSHALNKGLKKCTGDIFNWINSDDYLEPGALNKVAEAFEKTNANIVCGFSRIFKDSSGEEILRHRTELFSTTEDTLVQQRINQQGMFYKLSCIQSLGGINSRLHCIMDLELWFRYLCNTGQSKIYLLDELLAHFRIHNESKTGSQEQKFREEENAMWYYLLQSLAVNKDWLSFFKGETIYSPVRGWDFNKVDKTKLLVHIAEKNMDNAYKSRNIAFCKKAFYRLYKAGKLSISLQNVAMFVKIYIGDIPFRKFMKHRA